jgi:hypothetical protein
MNNSIELDVEDLIQGLTKAEERMINSKMEEKLEEKEDELIEEKEKNKEYEDHLVKVLIKRDNKVKKDAIQLKMAREGDELEDLEEIEELEELGGEELIQRLKLENEIENLRESIKREEEGIEEIKKNIEERKQEERETGEKIFSDDEEIMEGEKEDKEGDEEELKQIKEELINYVMKKENEKSHEQKREELRNAEGLDEILNTAKRYVDITRSHIKSTNDEIKRIKDWLNGDYRLIKCGF